MFYACGNYHDAIHDVGSGLNLNQHNQVDYVSTSVRDMLKMLSEVEEIPMNPAHFKTIDNRLSPVVMIVYADEEQQTPMYAVVEESHHQISTAQLDVRYTP